MLQLPIAEADEVRNSQTGEIVTNSFLKAALYQTLWKVYNAVHLGASVSLLVPELSGWLNRIINNVFVSVLEFRKLFPVIVTDGLTAWPQWPLAVPVPDVVLIVFNDLKWWHLTPRSDKMFNFWLSVLFKLSRVAGRGGAGRGEVKIRWWRRSRKNIEKCPCMWCTDIYCSLLEDIGEIQ